MPEKSSGKRVAPDEAWIAVRVPAWAKERLEKWAEHKDVSLSWIMRRLLLRALENKQDEGDGL